MALQSVGCRILSELTPHFSVVKRIANLSSKRISIPLSNKGKRCIIRKYFRLHTSWLLVKNCVDNILLVSVCLSLPTMEEATVFHARKVENEIIAIVSNCILGPLCRI